MRKFYLLFATLFSAIASAQTNAPIQELTVFTRGAQVTRVAEITLKKGIDTLVIQSLSPFLNQQTIKAKLARGKILDVSFNINYLTAATDQPKITKVKQNIKAVELDLLNLRDQLNFLELKYELIEKNQKIGGTATLDIEDLKDFNAYYNQALPDLIKKLTDTKQQIAKFELVKQKLEKQQNELQKTKTERTGEIEVIYQSDQQTKAQLQLSYNVNNCGWTPLYNLRAKDVSSPIGFEYTAEVYQNTGVNWKNIALTISTGNPVLNGEKPELYPLSLYPNYGRNQARLDGYADNEVVLEDRMMKSQAVMSMGKKERKETSSPVQSQNLTFSSFIIPQKFSLNTGGGKKKITLLEKSLPASYHYYAVPKKDNGVYLLAEITKWEKLPLIPGKSHIYFDETFVMKSYINPDVLNDTLAISLGKDQSILVQREKIEDKCFNNSNLLGVTKSRAYTLTVKNNRNEAIKIEIVDQIPISKNNKIKVDYKLGNSLVLKDDTGILTWELTVAAGEKSTTNFEFEVKHPKKFSVILR